MTHQELMTLAAELAKESVENGWGGPFGAVIAKDGEVVAQGQNRVLLTGDITAHAEIEAIRKAVQALNPYAPSIPADKRNESTLAFIPRSDGSPDPVPERSRMLMGMTIYASGAPCPMCMSAIYWSRLDAVYFSCDYEQTRAIGFDDAFQYEDFAKPLHARRLNISQMSPELGAEAYNAWIEKADRHPY